MPGESTVYQRLARRGFPVIGHYLGAVLTWPAYADSERVESEVARIEAAFPFTPEFEGLIENTDAISELPYQPRHFSSDIDHMKRAGKPEETP
jgi:hypothetical protein